METLIPWLGFLFFIIAALAIDIGAFHRRPHAVGMREAVVWTAAWIFSALLFNVLVYFIYQHGWFGLGAGRSGARAAAEFFTAWLVEKSLSLDNIFVFALVFSYFKIPDRFQHRVLIWGILGALVLRGIMIAGGLALIHYFSFMNYVFALILLYAALKMLVFKEESFDPQRNVFFKLVRLFYPISPQVDGQRFFTRLPNGRRAVTPLLVVLVVIESTDILFAVDSIPAVLGITRDAFIVFTSNVFAILGLRALYFVLLALIKRFIRLKLSLVLVLVFIAVKMLLEEYYEVPTGLSLGVVSALLLAGIAASLISPPSNVGGKRL